MGMMNIVLAEARAAYEAYQRPTDPEAWDALPLAEKMKWVDVAQAVVRAMIAQATCPAAERI